MSFDVITTGRVGVDLYPEQIGLTLAEVTSFRKTLGGSPTNVAVAAARLGCSAAVVTKVGDDGFGTFVRGALRAFGVDDRWVGTEPVLRTPLAFCEIHPPDDFPLLFYREPSAPDLQLTLADFDLDAVRSARLFWTTGTGLSAQPSRDAVLGCLRARRGLKVHDLDHRPMFWSSDDEAGRWAREALPHVTVAVGNQDEVAVAVGTRDAHLAAAKLLELGVEIAIVKRGGEGVLARTGDTVIELDAVPTEVVNGLGAGDAFGGALCRALIDERPLEDALRLANAAGALVASRLSCADDMPTRDELEHVLA